MKNSKIYLLCTLLFLTTMNSFGQNDTSFSFNLKNVSIPEFANQIEAKSTYRVFYNPDIFDRIYISFNSSNKSIRSILTSVFEGSDIYFSIDLDNHIFLTKRKFDPSKKILLLTDLQQSNKFFFWCA